MNVYNPEWESYLTKFKSGTVERNTSESYLTKFKSGTVERNTSTMGPPAGLEPIRLCDAGAMILSLSYRDSLQKQGLFRVFFGVNVLSWFSRIHPQQVPQPYSDI